jgi:hypothetical protein
MTGAGPLGEGHDRAKLAVPGCRGQRQRPIPQSVGTTPSLVVLLACTACQLVYEPDFAAFDTGNTGCPRCGGWTWIAHLGAPSTEAAGGGEAR